MVILDGPVLYWGLRKVEWVRLAATLVAVAVGAVVTSMRLKAHGRK